MAIEHFFSSPLLLAHHVLQYCLAYSHAIRFYLAYFLVPSLLSACHDKLCAPFSVCIVYRFSSPIWRNVWCCWRTFSDDSICLCEMNVAVHYFKLTGFFLFNMKMAQPATFKHITSDVCSTLICLCFFFIFLFRIAFAHKRNDAKMQMPCRRPHTIAMQTLRERNEDLWNVVPAKTDNN